MRGLDDSVRSQGMHQQLLMLCLLLLLLQVLLLRQPLLLSLGCTARAPGRLAVACMRSQHICKRWCAGSKCCSSLGSCTAINTAAVATAVVAAGQVAWQDARMRAAHLQITLAMHQDSLDTTISTQVHCMHETVTRNRIHDALPCC